ncbi:MAG: hypothetical protein ABIR52_15140 [Casimicrobiaceae bacterium]
MSAIDSRVRKWLIWALPFAAVAVLIGWETDWGRALTRVPALDGNVVPQPLKLALLPDYKVDGGVDGNRETVERTLFNPTRRPAPPTVVAAVKQAMPKGQFVLTGTTVVDQKATAFLREVSGGRSRRVQQGETVNGMLVAEIRADKVKLTQNDDSEELTLKVAAGPRSTVQPVVAPVPGQAGQPVRPGAPGAPGGAAQGQPVAGSQVAPVQDVADVLANRRRAARAAEAAAQVPPPAPPAAVAPAAAPAPARGADPAWNEVYQRYMQRGK